MPNNGKMDCYFNEQQAQAIALYGEKAMETEVLKSSTHVDLKPEGVDYETTETHDGEVVSNPWNDAIQDGTCIVSGY